jgi:hypothetical protein
MVEVFIGVSCLGGDGTLIVYIRYYTCTPYYAAYHAARACYSSYVTVLAA